jgi:3',5'-nucleoside bisphosphate phosphatase
MYGLRLVSLKHTIEAISFPLAPPLHGARPHTTVVGSPESKNNHAAFTITRQQGGHGMNVRSRILISILIIACAVSLATVHPARAQLNARKHIAIPDILEYQTLACDFHMHTVFSDGDVWPTVRVQEAWREGIDAISITDHIEYQPKRSDIPTNLNRNYEVALPVAESLDIILIRGTEITRAEPMGHHNALFVDDVNPLALPDSVASILAAVEQGAFIHWNHPGWQNQGGRAYWTEIQDTLFDSGLLNGIEVVNSRSYYPDALAFSIKNNLTILGNSDNHPPMGFTYDLENGEHRPMTLVFATERSAEAIEEALFARRTAVYWKNMLIGREEFLEPIFEESVRVINPYISITGRGRARIQLENTSDVPFELEFAGDAALGIAGPRRIVLPAHRTVVCTVSGTAAADAGVKSVRLPFRVVNCLVAPDTPLTVYIPLTVALK